MVGCLILSYLCAESEVQRNRHLAGRPVAVYTRGRVSELSPEAEEAGLRLGMSLGHAHLICPGAEFLPYDQDLYSAAQESVLAVCATYLSVVEPLSLQEIFFALPDAAGAGSMLAEIAREVHSQLGFTCRMGAGISKLVAHIAAGERPGTVVRAGEEAGFLAPLSVSKLAPPHLVMLRRSRNIPSLELSEEVLQHLHDLGLHTIGLLQKVSVSFLTSRFGPLGKTLHELAFGLDHSPVQPLYPPPMIAARLALPGGVEDAVSLEIALRTLAAQVAAQLRGRGQDCRQVRLIIDREEGKSISRSLRSGSPLACEESVFLAAQRLLNRARLKAPVAALTLHLAALERAAGAQTDLWGWQERRRQEARERLGKALSSIRGRFGEQGARWAAEIEVPRREQVLACCFGSESTAATGR